MPSLVRLLLYVFDLFISIYILLEEKTQGAKMTPHLGRRLLTLKGHQCQQQSCGVGVENKVGVCQGRQF